VRSVQGQKCPEIQSARKVGEMTPEKAGKKACEKVGGADHQEVVAMARQHGGHIWVWWMAGMTDSPVGLKDYYPTRVGLGQCCCLTQLDA